MQYQAEKKGEWGEYQLLGDFDLLIQNEILRMTLTEKELCSKQ